MDKTLPVFTYPTTIVLVDDDATFLKSIDLALDHYREKKLFSSAVTALSFFATYQKSLNRNRFLYGDYEHENYDLLAFAPVNFDVTRIAQHRDPRHNSQEVSVVVCDYDMPEINGLKLCEKLQAFSLKKLLLTGEAQDDDVIKAFNNGLIDQFLRKDSSGLIQEIEKSLKKLIRKYFCEQTKPILSHLEVDYLLPLSDPIFVNFFDKWCEDNQIVEFYLIDKQGSFLTINSSNKTHYFIIHTDRSLNKFSDIYLNDPLLQDLKKMVSTRSKIPFFGNAKEAHNFDISEWQNYFYQPTVLEGREKYYWLAL